MNSRGGASRRQIWAGLLVVYVVWGSTYLAIRLMVETIPALLGAGVRFFLAGAILLAVLAAQRGWSAVRVAPRSLAACALVGLLLPFGGNGLVTIAERHIPSGLAALLIASVPLWVVIYRVVLARERVGGRTLAGVFVGFAGVALLLSPGGQHGVHAIGLVLCIVAAGLWALGSFLTPRLPMPRDLLVSTGWQMLFGGLGMLIAAVPAGELGQTHLGEVSARSLGAFIFLITIGSLVAFTAYAWLLQNAPISLVATYAYVNPVVAVFLGWIVLNERLTALTAIGATIIVGSVAFIVSQNRVDRVREKQAARLRRTSAVP
ncbi:MAG: yedA [Solirubrobacterales bacterium]|nr:yedA [Solirubrobacterales bacterium]